MLEMMRFDGDVCPNDTCSRELVRDRYEMIVIIISNYIY